MMDKNNIQSKVMQQSDIGPLQKLTAQLSSDGQIQYQLPIGEQRIELNPLIGKTLSLHFQGNIACKHCGRKSKKKLFTRFLFSLHAKACSV